MDYFFGLLRAIALSIGLFDFGLLRAFSPRNDEKKADSCDSSRNDGYRETLLFAKAKK